MSNVEITTFGCRLNIYESEAIKEQLKDIPTGDNIIVFNTCAVTKEAEKQAIQRIHHYRLHNDKLAHQDHQEKRKQLLGELKMSDRQTIIILCYLLTCMS